MLEWFVKNYNFNANTIEDYDVLKYREMAIKTLKKHCETKAEFTEELRKEFMWKYWSRSEYELIIKKSHDGKITLSPWCGSKDPDNATIDVTDDESFDWKGFAEEHINKQAFKTEAKIDIYDQLTYGDNLNKLATLLWTTHIKGERDNPKFHEER